MKIRVGLCSLIYRKVRNTKYKEAVLVLWHTLQSEAWNLLIYKGDKFMGEPWSHLCCYRMVWFITKLLVIEYLLIISWNITVWKFLLFCGTYFFQSLHLLMSHIGLIHLC
jgi:hypothetical protein